MTNPVAWFEIVGKDGAKLRTFYVNLFGWRIDSTDSDIDYALVAAQDKGIGGGIGRSEDGGPGHVTFYVEVDDPATYLARAESLGGKTAVPPTDIPDYGLTFAFFTDPEGHLIGLARGAIR